MLDSVVVAMLPDDGSVEKVALGENGLIEGMSPGSVLLDMSTISGRRQTYCQDSTVSRYRYDRRTGRRRRNRRH